MADVEYQIEDIGNHGGVRGVKQFLWEGINTTDTQGNDIEVPSAADKTVQANGSFSGSAQLDLQGSNDGVNYFSLTDPLGNAIQLTAAGMKLISENPRYIRPKLASGGDGSTDIDVRIVAKGC